MSHNWKIYSICECLCRLSTLPVLWSFLIMMGLRFGGIKNEKPIRHACISINALKFIVFVVFQTFLIILLSNVWFKSYLTCFNGDVPSPTPVDDSYGDGTSQSKHVRYDLNCMSDNRIIKKPSQPTSPLYVVQVFASTCDPQHAHRKNAREHFHSQSS